MKKAVLTTFLLFIGTNYAWAVNITYTDPEYSDIWTFTVYNNVNVSNQNARFVEYPNDTFTTEPHEMFCEELGYEYVEHVFLNQGVQRFRKNLLILKSEMKWLFT